MRAIRYGETMGSWSLVVFQSQSAMRAIRYGVGNDDIEPVIEIGRNPLCVQLDMEKKMFQE